MTTLPEERVLQSLDPVPDDVNEWPDFALKDVKIFYQGKSRYADLLEASDETPLCVLGELMPLEDEQTDIALIENADYARIKIENVSNYSFGQKDDGKPVVWAAGKAGWYEITPSDRYLNHYNDTIEAIDLFYFLVDQHQKLPRKRQRLSFTIDPFLTAYQKHTDYRIDDDDEAMETLHKHHRFLLKQMIEEREGIDWSQTHLWKHLAEVYSDEVEKLRAGLIQMQNGQNGVEESEAEEEAADSSSEDASQISEDAEDGESESEPENEVEPQDWTHAIWTLLNILRKSENFSIRHCGIDQLATEFQKYPEFDGDHEEAVAAIERAAAPLLRLMDVAKLRKKFNWSTRTIYDELEATLADEVADDQMIIETPANKPDKRHRQKSVLRPSGASKARKRTRLLAKSEDEDTDMGEPPANSSPAARRLPQRDRREATVETYASLEDSPSRQLNGHIDSLPELPPGPEAQEMLDLVARESKMVGRQHQTSHLEAFLGQWVI